MRICLYAIVMWVLVTICSAQSSPDLLTLNDCIRLAQSAPSALSVAGQQSEIARYSLTQVRAGFFPQAWIGNAYTYNSPLAGSPDRTSFLALNGIREYNSVWSTALEVDTSGRLRAALERARADRDAATANEALTQRDLKRVVAAGYFRLLLARRLIRVAQDALAEAQRFEARTKLLFENGEVAQADLVKASSQVAFLDQALNAAQTEAQVANHDLASFWTTNVDSPLPLLDVFDQPVPPPDAEPLGAPFMRRPEFDLMGAQRRGFLADSRRARAELLPQARLVFEYGIDSTHAWLRDRGYGTFVHLNIPVFDWLRSHSLSRQFALRAQQVETNRAIAERTFSRDYQNALTRVKQIYRQIAITERQVKFSEENLRLSRIRYEGGEGSALDVVAAQNQLAQARTNYYTALSNYLNARADLEVAAGR